MPDTLCGTCGRPAEFYLVLADLDGTLRDRVNLCRECFIAIPGILDVLTPGDPEPATTAAALPRHPAGHQGRGTPGATDHE
jgi:hypothetical protein